MQHHDKLDHILTALDCMEKSVLWFNMQYQDSDGTDWHTDLQEFI